MTSITELITSYQKTGKGYQEISDRISLIVYQYPERIQGLSEEDKCDFYLSFYNRIDGLIKNFVYKGFPFETLLSKTLKWHSRTYLSEKKEETRYFAAEVEEEEVKLKDELMESEQFSEKERMVITFRNKTSKKRLLYLLLMDSQNLDDESIRHFSIITGYEYEWLLNKKDAINALLLEKSRRLNELREKRNRTYMKLRYKEYKLADETDSQKKTLLNQQISRLKKRFKDTCHEISRVPCRPTHNEVAKLLNIPKGTVDSGIHYLKKKCSQLNHQKGTGLIL